MANGADIIINIAEEDAVSRVKELTGGVTVCRDGMAIMCGR